MESEVGYLRIATEEAFAPPELIALGQSMLTDGTCDDPGFVSLHGFYLRSKAERPAAVLARLQDLGERRIADMLDAGLDGAIYGFAVETGMHLLRIITVGVFDRFPGLRMVVGHLGEALPFWTYRLDYMHAATVRAGRYESMKPIKQRPSDYAPEEVTAQDQLPIGAAAKKAFFQDIAEQVFGL
jgi:hypothetical protein